MKTLFKPKIKIAVSNLSDACTPTPGVWPQTGICTISAGRKKHFTTSFFSWFCVDAVPISQTRDLVSEIGESDGELDIESFYPNQSIAASPTMTATRQDHFLQYSHTGVSFTSAV